MKLRIRRKNNKQLERIEEKIESLSRYQLIILMALFTTMYAITGLAIAFIGAIAMALLWGYDMFVKE